MSELAIEIQNLSKLYRLGSINTGSLRQDIYYWWRQSILKKESSFVEEQDEAKAPFIWALNDVSFTVKQGEALGIIGSNGSGKSTLLKIIAHIIKPTKGVVRGKGKISSILEIGTGFHHELSGRENIFMSGYTLGMTKHEIRSKFDEIVAFSGIERFIDTPVKRYSSGMYVRLAFAVAAHLEPDILIVDEVLAVGDVEFQKKCMGKMQQVSGKEGRTVLFVSHNLPAVANLCTNALWLNKGKLVQMDTASALVKSYLASTKHEKTQHSFSSKASAPGNDFIRLKAISVQAHADTPQPLITVNTPIQLDVDFWCSLKNCNVNINISLFTTNGECVFNIGTVAVKADEGVLALNTVIPGNLLNNDTYSISLTVIKNNAESVCHFSDAISFDVEDIRDGIHYFGKWQGIIRPRIDSLLYMKNPAYV